MIEISVFLICDGLWAFPIRIAWPRTHTEATARARDKYDTSKGGGRAHRYISHSATHFSERASGQREFEDTPSRTRRENKIAYYLLVLTNKDILRALGRRHDGWLACSDTADAPATGPSHHAHTPTPTPTRTRTHTRTHAQARTRARHTNVSSQCKDEGTTSIRRPAWPTLKFSWLDACVSAIFRRPAPTSFKFSCHDAVVSASIRRLAWPSLKVSCLGACVCGSIHRLAEPSLGLS